ncbi:MAG: T9SS type A sorting domain-containing protein [Bacteroidota bacterium]|nr:T9SS type A sorting domain-containing protein [Bacteroidota bacterium]
MKKIKLLFFAIIILVFLVAAAVTTMDDFFLPGSQVGQSGNLETPDKCDNCHGGYDIKVEPAFNWRGSMMSQAARDPLFYACLAIANQDAPGVGDLCLRCHTPDGWLNGRCVPTDGSALNNNDRQGVQCDFCHKMVKPTTLGVNPFPLNVPYTSTAYGSGTYTQDQAYLKLITPLPLTSANGMYMADANNAKRGPFTDATGRHQMFYSPFHSQSEICGTCHDVSNPAFTRIENTNPDYKLNTSGLKSETFDLRLMFPVERTYSEWMASGYNNPTSGYAKTCQDCHMRDVTGKGAKMNDAPIRTNLPLHDMTGGNTFVPKMVKAKYPAEVNAQALDAGMERAKNNLQNSALFALTVNAEKTTATVKVTNTTGHKLPTGYPEGRRMWINLKAYSSAGSLLREFGAYNLSTAVLTKGDTKIYECEPGITQEVSTATGIPVGPSFHFAINSKIYFDNRIPPAGFTNAKLIEYQSPVVDHGGKISTTMYPDGQNWDETSYLLPAGTAKVEAKLYYQTTSKEYVEFLRDANTTNTAGQELYNLWLAHGKSAPELMNSATWPSVSNVMEASIQSVLRTTSKQGVAYASAIVLVKSNNLPLAGAEVTATYTGPTSGTITGNTGTDGKVTLKTSTLKTTTGQWCFTVNSVAKNGYTYPGTNPQLCETVSKGAFMPQESIAEASLKVYPNPVQGKASIIYTIADPVQTRLAVYNGVGQQIVVLTDKFLNAGEYIATWDGSGYPAGIYHVRMNIGSKLITQTLILKK